MLVFACPSYIVPRRVCTSNAQQSVAPPRAGRIVARAAPDNSSDQDQDDPDQSAAPPKLYGDWREFRAKLIADASNVNWSTRLSEENIKLLQVQNPKLAAEEFWAHATTQPEAGGLLLATRDAHRIARDAALWQAVIFVVQHSSDGSVGLILNRPSSLRMRVGKGGLPFYIIGAPQGMQECFADNRVYCGGPVRQEVFHLLHGHNLEGALEVAPGVYVGGQQAAVAAVKDGLIAADEFKFFSGAMVWEGGQLQKEIDRGVWYIAAASRPMVLKQCLQLPKPLWKEILTCMGGDYAEVANEPEVDY